jgi:hypothetical protein
LNPQQPDPQSGTLPLSYSHHVNLVFYHEESRGASIFKMVSTAHRRPISL